MSDSPPAKLQVRVTCVTNSGAVRPHNEDSIIVGIWSPFAATMAEPHVIVKPLSNVAFTCVVADGMGGHNSGEIASAHVIEAFRQRGRKLDGEKSLTRMLSVINEELFDAMENDVDRSGMGTTVAGVVFLEDQIVYFNVGDSRVYREQNGTIQQLSTDDTSQTPAGLPFWRKAPKTPARRSDTAITQALGGAMRRTKIEPHTGKIPVAAGLRLIVCSDGLTDMLDAAKIQSCIADGGGDDLLTVKKLLQCAIEAGGEDNISILLTRVELAVEPAS